jgi:hypothetical protein
MVVPSGTALAFVLRRTGGVRSGSKRDKKTMSAVTAAFAGSGHGGLLPSRRPSNDMSTRPRSTAGDPMTLGNMRANGVRSLDVSCWQCDHSREDRHRHRDRRGDCTCEGIEARLTDAAQTVPGSREGGAGYAVQASELFQSSRVPGGSARLPACIPPRHG